MKKIGVILFGLTLSACASGDAQEVLGLKIDAPDEFAVERKPKLDVPPSFNLRPPTPGEAPVNAADTREVAKEQIIGVGSNSGSTEGEKAILGKMGVTSANPDIRRVLTQEYPKTEDKDVIDRIRAATGGDAEKTLVDADKEKKRIEDNKKENKSLTEGETPTKSTNDGKSVIDKIFN